MMVMQLSSIIAIVFFQLLTNTSAVEVQCIATDGCLYNTVKGNGEKTIETIKVLA